MFPPTVRDRETSVLLVPKRTSAKSRLIAALKAGWLDSRKIRYLLLAIAACWSLPGQFAAPPEMGIGYAWQAALQLAVVDGKTFGQDFVFVYGPLGDLLIRAYQQGIVAALRSLHFMQPIVHLSPGAAAAAECHGCRLAFCLGICDQNLPGRWPFGRPVYGSLLLAMANLRPRASIGRWRQPDRGHRAILRQSELWTGGARAGSRLRDRDSRYGKTAYSGRGIAFGLFIASLAWGRHLARRSGTLCTLGNRIGRRIYRGDGGIARREPLRGLGGGHSLRCFCSPPPPSLSWAADGFRGGTKPCFCHCSARRC